MAKTRYTQTHRTNGQSLRLTFLAILENENIFDMSNFTNRYRDFLGFDSPRIEQCFKQNCTTHYQCITETTKLAETIDE